MARTDLMAPLLPFSSYNNNTCSTVNGHTWGLIRTDLLNFAHQNGKIKAISLLLRVLKRPKKHIILKTTVKDRW